MQSNQLSKQQFKSVSKYVAQYAEHEVTSLANFPSKQKFEHVLVIPAFQEDKVFLERFIQSPLAQQQCLVIVVINQPNSDLGQQYAHAQLELAKAIYELGQLCWQNGSLRLIELSAQSQPLNSAVLVADRFTLPIPAEQGVGLARKIGADIAAALYLNGNISSPWIHSTDADAALPENYFTAHQQENIKTKNNTGKSIVASCCNFFHHSDHQAIHQANALYEKALRYYVAGLTYAQSPYNYFTIGSTLSFDVIAYSQARGFPKRSAGEDFYLLNKLAKLGAIVHLPEVVIKLDARPSQRVPFGTGPAVKSIMELTAQGMDYDYYHPEVFIELKHCLAAFDSLWQQREKPALWLEKLTVPTQNALTEIGLLAFISKQKGANQGQFNKQLIVWFDSFKTLKFIHALRANGLKNIALKQALNLAPFHL